MDMENLALQRLLYNKKRGLGIKETIYEKDNKLLHRNQQSQKYSVIFPLVEPMVSQRKLPVSQFVDESYLREPMPLELLRKETV